MPKFFVPKQDIEADTLCIREDRHHILHVLRQTVGDSLIVCDGEGTDYACTIMEIHDDVLICRIDRREEASVEPKLRITLCQGLPKAEKMEWILQKCTELGMVRCIPVVTQRSVVRLEEKKKKEKTLRWNKIVQSAAKQSGRARIPEVTEPITLTSLPAMLRDTDHVIVLYEDETTVSLKEVLNRWEKPASVALVIGPEGGWDPKEIEELKKAGAVTAGLGPRILRTETAGPTAVALTLYHYDEMA